MMWGAAAMVGPLLGGLFAELNFWRGVLADCADFRGADGVGVAQLAATGCLQEDNASALEPALSSRHHGHECHSEWAN
jgi:MFS family permease